MRCSRNYSRREFVKTAGALPLALTRSAWARVFPEVQKIPVGVQLYCVRHELPRDMAGTLAALARMGFEGVEFADYFNHSAVELRKLLDDRGLKCCGTHIYLEDMLGDKLEPTVEFNKTLGNPYLVVRWLPEERRKTKEAFMQTVELFNEVSEKLRPHGMRIGYHNHDYIFEKMNGETLWNILADKTRKEVFLQLDTGNASETGQDVVSLLKRNQGRTATMHVKPYSASHPDVFLGQDELPWETILQLVEETGGLEWYIVEYEREGTPPLEALKANLEFMRKMGR